MSAALVERSPDCAVHGSALSSGESGGAVTFGEDGRVTAMHLETLNQAMEHVRMDVDDAVASLDPLIRKDGSLFLFFSFVWKKNKRIIIITIS